MAILKVTNTNDSGNGSLRAAVAGANPGDTIEFDPSLKGRTIKLTGGELALGKDVTIDGDVDNDHKADITISGADNYRIFDITGSSTDVVLESLTLTHGFAASYGGAIYASSGTNLTITDSAVTHSYSSGHGGGIAAFGTLLMANATISDNYAIVGGGLFIKGITGLANVTIAGNTSGDDAGGIETSGASLYVYDSTISDNHSGHRGGGLDLFGGTAALVTNSVIAGNTATTSGTDISDTGGTPNFLDAISSFFGTDVSGLPHFTDNGGNQNNGGNPKLGPLGDHGGTVQTMALLNGSPLIDGGSALELPDDTLDVDHDHNTTETLPLDANGNSRVKGSGLDIGAVEFTGPVVTTASDSLPDSTFAGSMAADAADGGGLSLREAIHWAQAGDTITFDSSLKGQTITLLAGELALTQDLTIDGDVNGDHKADITISGDANNSGKANAGDSRIFIIAGSGVDVTLRSLTLTNGYYGGSGGAISTGFGTRLSIVDSTITNSRAISGGGISAIGNLYAANTTFSGNYAVSGGGLAVTGGAVLVNVTVTGNEALQYGGGIETSGAHLFLYDSTIAGNHAGNQGGGIDLFQGSSAAVINTVVAGNTATTAGDDISDSGSGANTLDAAYSFFGTDVSGVGTFNDNGGNQNNAGDPLLGALGDHGGTVKTLALLAGSPLIDRGNAATLLPLDIGDVDHDGTTLEFLPIDANGNPRVQGGLDIGATQFVAEPQFFMSGDFNGDGIDDMAWRSRSSGYVATWLLNSSTHRTLVHPSNATSDWEALAPGDYNGDGIDDIAWRNTSTGYVSVWLMDSNGHRHAVHSGDASSAWEALAPGDFNGDGIDDIAWRNTATGYVSVWLMDSNGHRHVVHSGDASSDWQALAPGDYNGDGIDDIAWRNSSTGYVSVWLMNSNGHRHVVHPSDATSDWQALAPGDYNGDGITDIAWRNTATGYVSVWLMDSNGHRHAVHSGDASSDWQALGSGDYNGDGIDDMAWRNTATGYVSVWLMDKNGKRHFVHSGDATADWQALSPGDYNGDGITDIAWRNTSTGYVSVWQMDKNAHRHVVHPSDAPNIWQAV